MQHFKNKFVLGLVTLAMPFMVNAQTVTLPVPAHVSPVDNAALTSSNFTSAVWQTVTSGTAALSYYYEAAYSAVTNLDGGFSSPLFTSPQLFVPTVSTTGMPDGTYLWHVRSADTNGNKSSWSAPWKVTIDNVAPGAPGVPVVISAIPPVASGTTPAPSTTGITLATVASHSTATDCWMIISGKVYSVGSYAAMHPGGKMAVTNLCGQDATTGFNTRGGSGSHSNSAKTTLGTYYVGDLVTTTTTPTPTSTVAKPGTQVWSFASSTDLLSGVASYEYSIDGGLTWISNGTSTLVTTNFDFGARSLTVRAIDRAGNKSIVATGSYTVTSVGITPAPGTPVTPVPGTKSPTKEKDCKRGGWKTYKTLKFKSEKKCVDYAKKAAEKIKKQAEKQREEEKKREEKRREDDKRDHDEDDDRRASSTKEKSKNLNQARGERGERD